VQSVEKDSVSVTRESEQANDKLRLQSLRDLLRDQHECEMIRAERSFHEETAELLSAPCDVLDFARSIEELELYASLRERRRQQLTAIRDAFDRLRLGTYGLCEDCGDRIAAERLKMLSLCRRCVDCQQERETRSRLSPAERGSVVCSLPDREDDELPDEVSLLVRRNFVVEDRRFGARARRPDGLRAATARRQGQRKRAQRLLDSKGN